MDIYPCITFGHNPYFNRWFSAIYLDEPIKESEYGVTILILIDGFLQYRLMLGWNTQTRVTILILIDGFLQYFYVAVNTPLGLVTILILIDGFLQ